MSNTDVLNDEQREGYNAIQNIMTDIGVQVELDADGRVDFKRTNYLAGLSMAERETYSHIGSSTAAEQYRAERLNEKYPEDYLQVKVDTGLTAEQQAQYDAYAAQNGTAAEEYRKAMVNQNTAASRQKQEVFDELSMLERANDPGYLNSLSEDEFNDFCNEYVTYKFTHQSGVYGYTDEELSGMSEEEISLIKAENMVYVNEFNELIGHDGIEPSADQQHGDSSQDSPQQESPSEEPQQTSPADGEPASNGTDDSKDNGVSSTWNKLKENVSVAFTAIGNWFASTEVGEWVIDKYNDIFNKDKEVEAETSNELVPEEKTEEQIADERAKQADEFLGTDKYETSETDYSQEM